MKKTELYPFYFDGNLESKRFENDNIWAAINLARKRFSDEIIYYLTDEYPIAIADINLRSLDLSDLSLVLADKETTKVFVCAFESDEKLLKVLIKILKEKKVYYYTPSKYYPTARYFHRNDIARRILTEEKNLSMPKFEVADFENIIQALDITKDVSGDYVEIGVYQGRSAHLALHYMRAKGIHRKSYFIDIFEGFTYEAALKSPDALWANSHTDSSYEVVSKFLSEFDDLELLKLNIISDELPDRIETIAVCNIDVDLYEAVGVSLIKIAPLMIVGGVIIVEDQGHTPALAGGFAATAEFLETNIAKSFIPVHMTSGQMFLIRYK